MSSYVTLVGAEEVSRAASTIRAAAQEMSRAAASISDSVDRLGGLIERLLEVTVKLPTDHASELARSIAFQDAGEE